MYLEMNLNDEKKLIIEENSNKFDMQMKAEVFTLLLLFLWIIFKI